MSLALPWLEALAPAAVVGQPGLAEPPLRTAFLFMPWRGAPGSLDTRRRR